MEDAGKYKVTAKNELGESNATISLNFDSKYNTKLAKFIAIHVLKHRWYGLHLFAFAWSAIILVQPIFYDQYINIVQLCRKIPSIEELNWDKLL